jgi:hypothetical protein
MPEEPGDTLSNGETQVDRHPEYSRANAACCGMNRGADGHTSIVTSARHRYHGSSPCKRAFSPCNPRSAGRRPPHLPPLARAHRRQARRLPDARAGGVRTGGTATPRGNPDRRSVSHSSAASTSAANWRTCSVLSASRGRPRLLRHHLRRGLVTPETLVTLDCLRELAGVPIDPADIRYREPLERTVTELFAAAGPDCDYVLLGSVATTKYLEPISAILGVSPALPAGVCRARGHGPRRSDAALRRRGANH